MNVRRGILGIAAGLISLLLVACASDQPLAPSHQEIVALSAAAAASGNTPETPRPNDAACWGQASAVFAQMGLMGEHSSSFAGDPRIGLRNLARDLYEANLLPDDTMASLGVFVAQAYELSIAACGTDGDE